MTIQRYHSRRSPAGREGTAVSAARYEPGAPPGDLIAVARMADGEVAEVMFPSYGPVLIARWVDLPGGPWQAEYEAVEAWHFLAYAESTGRLFSVSEENARQWWPAMHLRSPSCRGARYGTDQSAAAHGPHEFFPHEWAPATPCPGWSAEEASAAAVVEQVWQYAHEHPAPDGTRLEGHPALIAGIGRLLEPDFAVRIDPDTGLAAITAVSEVRPVIPDLDGWLTDLMNSRPPVPGRYELRCHPDVFLALCEASDRQDAEYWPSPPMRVGGPLFGSAAIIIRLELGSGGWELYEDGDLLRSGRIGAGHDG